MVRNSSVERMMIPYFSKRLGVDVNTVYEIAAEIYNPDQITFDICIVNRDEEDQVFSTSIDRAKVEPIVPFLTILAEESYNRYCERFFYRNGGKRFAGTAEMERNNNP